MSIRQGDLVSSIDAYGRSVSGVAGSDGATGYVTLTPSLRPDGGQWIQPAAVTVEARQCRVIESHELGQQRPALRDRAYAGRTAMGEREAAPRDRAQDERER